MQPDNEVKLPPPVKKARRRLTLEHAMHHLQRGKASDMGDPLTSAPLMQPKDEFPTLRTGQQQEMEAHLLELQADIIRREDSVGDKERKLMEWERELNEKEALLEARRSVIESSISRNNSGEVSQQMSTEEQHALIKLKAELDAQECALKESRLSLRDRERYIEECENALVEKSMELSEREAHIEQDEEDKTYDRKQD